MKAIGQSAIPIKGGHSFAEMRADEMATGTPTEATAHPFLHVDATFRRVVDQLHAAAKPRQRGLIPRLIEPPANTDNETRLMCALGFWKR